MATQQQQQQLSRSNNSSECNYIHRNNSTSTSCSTSGGSIINSININDHHNEELSRNEALEKLMYDEDLSDITLQSYIDGTKVTANRALLAIRSPVFRTMLYGQFAESSQKIVKLDFTGDIIRAIVEYIYTDKVLRTLVDNRKRNKRRKIYTTNSSNGNNNNNNGINNRHRGNNKKRANGDNDYNVDDEDEMNFEFAKKILAMMDAANFLELPKLRKECENLAKEEMDSNSSSLAMCFLALCEQRESLRWSDTETYAEKLIAMDPSLLLKHKEILSLFSFRRIENLVHNKQMRTDEFTLFQVVQSWATTLQPVCGNGGSSSSSTSIIEDSIKVTPKRARSLTAEDNEGNRLGAKNKGGKVAIVEDMHKIIEGGKPVQSNMIEIYDTESISSESTCPDCMEISQQHGLAEAAKKLLKHINLSLIEPSILATEVANSGFVTEEKLLEAFKEQALRAERQKSVKFSCPRVHVWESNNDVSFGAQTVSVPWIELLKCEPLRLGIHKWTILLQETCPFASLGISSFGYSHAGANGFLGYSKGGWVAEAAGRIAHDDNNHSGWLQNTDYLKFGKGSYVTFILDLTGSGELSGYVDGGETKVLFSNIFSRFDSDSRLEASFVPAVCLRKPGRAKFLGFHYDV